MNFEVQHLDIHYVYEALYTLQQDGASWTLRPTGEGLLIERNWVGSQEKPIFSKSWGQSPQGPRRLRLTIFHKSSTS